jgi:pimeloyl-ACP methyl ester carboxylesterase
MKKIISQDGTIIAFDQIGKGPAVVLICGGSVDRSSNAQLAMLLADSLTAFNYDRRGRGDSGDTPPYAVKREIEDIEAVISAAGGSAALYGSSSGAALALEAAYALPGKVSKLALWEPPYFVDRQFHPPPADTAETFIKLVSAGKRAEAVEFFMAPTMLLLWGTIHCL